MVEKQSQPDGRVFSNTPIVESTGHLVPPEISGPSGASDSTFSRTSGGSVNYDDTSVIDRRRFYIAQPNDYSCAPTSLTEALFDFNASGGNSGVKFDGASYADPNTRMAARQTVEAATGEPAQEFGSIDDEAGYAQQFGLNTKVHFDPNVTSITQDNVNDAMNELNSALASGHGVIINVPHHFVYCAGRTPDGRYVMGDPAESGTGTWDAQRMASEMDHSFDPFNSNWPPTPTGFVEVWNPDKPVHSKYVSSGDPDRSAHVNWQGIPRGQRTT